MGNKIYFRIKAQTQICLRLGRLVEEQALYIFKPTLTKDLANGKLKISDLKQSDYILSVNQKGVDMKIGIDITSLAYKRLVDRIILISGDSDFVPALKLARREGIDIILDPMRAKVKEDLYEHIDGIRTKILKKDPLIQPKNNKTTAK